MIGLMPSYRRRMPVAGSIRAYIPASSRRPSISLGLAPPGRRLADCSQGCFTSATARLSRPLTVSSDAAASRARDRSSSHGSSALTAASMSASLTGFCGGHSGTSFSSRVDELVDLALGLEPGDIAFDRVFMHFAE